MWNDDTQFESVEERDIENEIPDEDREWAEWFVSHTLPVNMGRGLLKAWGDPFKEAA